MEGLELGADLEKLEVQDILGSIGKIRICTEYQKSIDMEKWKLLTEKKRLQDRICLKNMKTFLYNIVHMYVYEDVGGDEPRITVVISRGDRCFYFCWLFCNAHGLLL